VPAFKVMREVKYCTVQLVLQVVSNLVSCACIEAVSRQAYGWNIKVFLLLFKFQFANGF